MGESPLSHEEKPPFTVFSLNANRPLAEKVAACLGRELGRASIVEHSDGETKIIIEDSIRGQHIFLIQSTSHQVNENIMETLIMMDALKRASALTINVILPYYAYARQDRKALPREPITAKLVADLLQAAGADRVITLDLHSAQIQGFFDIPVDHLSAIPLLADYFLERDFGGEDTVVVAPNHSGVGRVRKMAECLKVPIAIVDKRDHSVKGPNMLNIIGEVEGKTCILADDLIDTAETVTVAAQALKAKGAKEVYAVASHAVFSDSATAALENAPIKKVVVTDSIYLPPEKQIDKIVQISVAELIAYAITCVYEEKSLHPK